MIHKEQGYRAATTEVCSLYVDLNIRKVVEIEQDKLKKIDSFIDSNKKNFDSDHLNMSIIPILRCRRLRPSRSEDTPCTYKKNTQHKR